MFRTLSARLGWRPVGVLVASLALGCGGADGEGSAGETVGESNETWKAPAEGSCEALGMLLVANEATFEELDVDAALDRRAAENIVAARPIDTVAELDEVSYVGPSALSKILDYAGDVGHLAPCGGDGAELGIVSDLDKTVIPSAEPDLSQAPYPGVAALYQLLEHKSGGNPGDVFYVTARTPESVTEIPAYLADHGVPAGPIETGVSGVPWIAEKEKISDVSRVLDLTEDQRFVLLGDSSHRDPEVYRAIIDKYPNRIVAGFIHKVNNVSPERVEGLVLHQSYAEVAAVLYGLGELTRDEALGVMQTAQEEGLDITAGEIEQLLDAQEP